ncbi:hypothetical protein EDB83DRAFT_2517234 [Lactarius deliciosus]|nr:hypothetical protein EDB83DRAFT_2517234 [Lactarius deliciosus]
MAVYTYLLKIESLETKRMRPNCCHVLELGRPFDASGSSELIVSLLDLVCSRLPTAEFAIPSACHTARMQDTSVADDALHLTSAVQHCRFRSMIETVQAIADMDGRDLAVCFYTPVFPSNAEALRDEEASVG